MFNKSILIWSNLFLYSTIVVWETSFAIALRLIRIP